MNREKHSKNPLLLIFITVFIDFMGLGVALPVLAPLFVGVNSTLFEHSTPLDDRTAMYGYILGIFSIAQFLGAPLLGAYSDRLGRRKVLTFASLVNSIGFLLFAAGIYLKSIQLLFFSRILSGFLGSSLPVVQSALADVSTEENKVRNFSLVGIGFGSGFLVGAIISGILSNPEIVPWFNFTTPFLFVALMNLVNYCFIYFKLPETLKEFNPHNIQFLSGFQNIQKAYNHKNLRLLFLMIFIMTIGFSFFLQFMQVHLITKFNYTEFQLGMFVAYFAVCVALSQAIVLRRVSLYIQPNKVLLFSIPLFALSYCLMIAPANHIWLYVFIPVMTTFQGLTYPNSLAILSNSSADNVQGEVIGNNQSVQSLAMAIPPLAGGYLMSKSINAPMLLGALCAFLGWITYLFYYTKKHHTVVIAEKAK
jgi:DHA1 family tetracycline resistance protein-like MFS transporter